MPVTTSNNQGLVIAFPDVCRTPSPPSGVPVPYPNIATTAKAKQQAKNRVGSKTSMVGSSFRSSTGAEAGVSKGIIAGTTSLKGMIHGAAQVELQGLKASLGNLTTQLQNMTSSDPSEWQKVIEQYVSTVSAIYVTIHT